MSTFRFLDRKAKVGFDGNMLYVNIKLWSESMGDEIDIDEKKELSLGYRCTYHLENGTFNGQEYEVRQRNILGNHLALVNEGRMGKDVAVQDHKPKFIITLDSKEIVKMAKKTAEQIAADKAKREKFQATCDSALEAFKKVNDAAAEAEKASESGGGEVDLNAFMSMFKQFAPMLTEFMATIKGMVGAEPAAEEGANDADPATVTPTDGDKPIGGAAMDSQIKALKATVDQQTVTIAEMQKNGIKSILGAVADRDALYEKVSKFTGAFDHKLLTDQEIAEKAVVHENIKIDCPKGEELAYLRGFLTANDRASSHVLLSAGDSSINEGGDDMNAFLATQA